MNRQGEKLTEEEGALNAGLLEGINVLFPKQDTVGEIPTVERAKAVLTDRSKRHRPENREFECQILR